MLFSEENRMPQRTACNSLLCYHATCCNDLSSFCYTCHDRKDHGPEVYVP